MITKDNERVEWLENLKIGDEVAINSGVYGGIDYEIRKVSRITPTRRFSLEGKSAEFDSNGIERAKSDVWRTKQKLQPVTKAITDHIRKKYVVARMENVKWRQMELEQLEKFLTVLDGI